MSILKNNRVELRMTQNGSYSVYIDGICNNEKNISSETILALVRKIERINQKKKWSGFDLLEFNINNAYANGYSDISDYIKQYSAHLDKEELKVGDVTETEEFKKGLIESFPSILEKEIGVVNSDFNIDKVNKKAEKNAWHYYDLATKEEKREIKNCTVETIGEYLADKWSNEGDEAYLRCISCIVDKKVAEAALSNLGAYEKDLYDFEKGEQWVVKNPLNEEFFSDKDISEEEKKRFAFKELVNQIVVCWKATEMIEYNTGFIACAIDGAGSLINPKKALKDEDSMLRVYTNGGGRLSDRSRKGVRYAGLMSIDVFNGTNSNLSSCAICDLHTYRVDRKFPDSLI